MYGSGHSSGAGAGAGAGGGYGRPAKRARTAAEAAPSLDVAAPAYASAHETVEDTTEQAGVRSIVKRLCSAAGASRVSDTVLPGPQATTMSNKHLAMVVRKCAVVGRGGVGADEAAIKAGYWVCEKSDGDRMMMLCMGGHAYLLNRSFVVSKVKGGDCIAKALSPRGDTVTLLDGELLTDISTHTTVYMVFDALKVAGREVHSRPLFDRLTAIGEGAIKPWKAFEKASPAEAGRCALRLEGKSFFPASRVQCVFDRIQQHVVNGKHGYVYTGAHGSNLNDGVVFTPGAEGYWQPHETLLKWKWFEDNTVDFVVNEEALDTARDAGIDEHGCYTVELKTWTGRSRGNFLHTTVTKTKLPSKTFEDIDQMITGIIGKENVVIECGYDVKASMWRPKCYRADKRKANYISVAWQTMEVMAENISKEDLIRRLAPAASGSSGAGGAAAGARR